MSKTPVPFRQIRAHYTPTTITVYQAYRSEIAKAAVEHQKLDASPHFSNTRMTWIKPSWAWMLYRSGYSYKDPGQERILALTLTHSAFTSLLRTALVSPDDDGDATDRHLKAKKNEAPKRLRVRVQWDPERTVKLGKLSHRSIQIGIPGALNEKLVQGIVKIEDVTDRARGLKKVLDEKKAENTDVDMGELMEQGFVVPEEVFEIDEELRNILKMDEVGTN
ncbi:hypothetical protein GQ44DRAFT_716137 [Phaeosphaeriaceae sp. PMI808]|nr:hypothetical protein GQ44DRAFT_716137 [Phaeosphaeriaceae sp. PMI808]